MMKKIILLSFLLLLIFESHAQRYDYMYNRKRNIFSFDIGGRTMFWSMNYERLFMPRERTFIMTTVGISYFIFPKLFSESNEEFAMYFPHGISFNLGKYKSYLEIGFHGSYVIDYFEALGKLNKMRGYLLSPILGYRHMGFKGGFVFKGFVALLNYIPITGESDFKLAPYPGMSVGYNF